jgi:HEAT repeat protein
MLTSKALFGYHSTYNRKGYSIDMQGMQQQGGRRFGYGVLMVWAMVMLILPLNNCFGNGGSLTLAEGEEGISEPLSEDAQRLINLLARNLTDAGSSFAVRLDAALSLLALDVPEAKQAVLKVLADTKNPEGRLAICRALGEMDRDVPEIFEPPLFEALAAENDAVREAAATALARCGNSVLQKVRNLIKDTERPLASRISALTALEKQPAPELQSLELLVGLVSDNKEPTALRRRAADALEQLTGEVGIGLNGKGWQKWLEKYRTKSPQHRLELLIQARDRIIRPLREENRRLRSAINDLVEKYVLAASTDNRQSLLLSMLRHDVPEVRLAGLRLAEKFVAAQEKLNPEVRGRIRELLSDSQPAIREYAANLIRLMRDPEAAEALATAIKREKSASVRAREISALAALSLPAHVDIFLSALSDSSDEVVIAAASALGGLLGDEKVRKSELGEKIKDALLKRYLKKSEQTPALKSALLESLSYSADPSVESLLTAALTKTSPEDAPIRMSAASGLARFKNGKTAPKTLAEALEKETDRQVQLVILRSLEQIGSTEQLEAVFRMIQSNPSDASLQQALWRCFIELLKQANTDQIRAWLERIENWPGGSPQTLLPYRIAILRLLVTKLSAVGGGALDEALAELGLLLADTNPNEEALAALQEALEQTPSKQREMRMRLGKKAVGVAIGLNKTDVLLNILKLVWNDTKPADRDELMQPVLAHIEQQLTTGQTKEMKIFVDQLVGLTSPDAETPWGEELLRFEKELKSSAGEKD